MSTFADMETPEERGRRAVDSLLGELRKEARHGRAQGYLGLGLALLFGVAFVAKAFSADVQPYPVAVDPQGRAVYYGPVEPLEADNPLVVRAELGKMIYYLRTVSTDPKLQADLLARGYAFTTPAAAAYIDNELRQPGADPRVLGVTVHRAITVESLLPVNEEEGRWMVRWREVTTPRMGGPGVTESWEASLAVERGKPPAKRRDLNPLGLYVKDLKWTRVNTGSTK